MKSYNLRIPCLQFLHRDVCFWNLHTISNILNFWCRIWRISGILPQGNKGSFNVPKSVKSADIEYIITKNVNVINSLVYFPNKICSNLITVCANNKDRCLWSMTCHRAQPKIKTSMLKPLPCGPQQKIHCSLGKEELRSKYTHTHVRKQWSISYKSCQNKSYLYCFVKYRQHRWKYPN